MYNGLADSIWAGSDNQATAWKWVKFLGSADCQNIVGEAGRRLPGHPVAATEKAEAAFEAKGIDVTPFTDQVEEGTRSCPRSPRRPRRSAIMKPAMDAVMGGRRPRAR